MDTEENLGALIGALCGIIAGVIILCGIGYLVNKSEEKEAQRFFECLERTENIDYCLIFERDQAYLIEKFNKCFEELGDIEWCHQQFLR